ncbi:uncharacterized protein [Typha latifolia]|uniref:uncharacterized protein isoform X1 n=1 Tax=Typha latifolia TaxID=4733 RepID=UPI003C304D54
MGCGGSKLEEERAVMHCLVRSQHLADAIRYRYDLADAHAAYVSSLRSVGASLHAFLNGLHSPLSHPSPHLQLPAQRKGGDAIAPLSSSSPPPPPAIKQQQSHSRSHSDSHIQFHSSEEDSDEDHHLHLHSDDDEPTLGPTYVNLNYARSQPAASSVTYEQRSVGPDAVVSAAEPSGSAYPYYGYPYPAQSSNFDPYAAQSSNYYPYQYSYPSYGATGGLFGSSSPPPNIPPPASAPGPGSPSSSRAPPPPPSPPRTSTWDFLNPFEAYDSYYAPAPYSPGRSLKDVREEEGIPDLEDEEPEIVKEAYGDKKVAEFSSGAAANMGEYSSKAAAAAKEDGIKSEMEAGSSSLEHDVHVVEKSVVGDEKSEERRNVAARVYHNDSEVVQDIMIQFNTASEAADQVSKMLEVGKLPYQRKDSVYKAVSAMMICGFPSTSFAMDEDFLNFEEDKAMGCGNLSLTLQKLLMWEKKLLDEVRAEEKIRIRYEREHNHLQHLIDTGAESGKLEATQTSIKKLSTRIRIAIQVVDGISKKISNLRDEELWPELCELVQGLTRMWEIMSECHHTQCQAISEAKNLDSVLSGAKLSDSHVAAAKQLELELWDWIANFSSWIDAQRNYVKSLNDWLNNGIVYEPEVTDDGVIPYSPGRLGAPSIFVICNYWSHSMEMISGSEVVNATQAFATNISHLREQHSFEQRQMLMANKDMDRKLRSMEREDQVMRKALEARNKKLVQVMGQSVVPLSGQLVHQAPPVEVSSLQSNLRQIFEAVDSFTATSAKAYEGLHKQLKEEKERFTKEKAEVS